MDINSIVKLTDDFCVLAEKKKKKPDPDAKLRNRGNCVFPANSKYNTSSKDRFPINDEKQARNAWARADQFDSAPDWFDGSLTNLQKLVKRKIKAEYPKISLEDKKSKKSVLNSNMTKQAALKEKIDASIDNAIENMSTVIKIAQRNMKLLAVLKASYYAKFDPELEHNIVAALPENIAYCSKAMRLTYQHINSLLSRAEESSAPTVEDQAAE